MNNVKNCIMLGEPSTEDRSGGETLLDHYWHANSESESMKYSTRGRDKHSTARHKRNTEIVASFQKDPERHLQIINEFNMEFMVRSQTKSMVWYALSLNTECCECEDHVAICKHLLAVRMLINGELQYLKRLLPSQEQMFYHDINDNFEEETPDFAQNVPSIDMWSPRPNNSLGIFVNSNCLKIYVICFTILII